MKQTIECVKCSGAVKSKSCTCAVFRKVSYSVFKNYFGCDPQELNNKLNQTNFTFACQVEQVFQSLSKFFEACKKNELKKNVDYVTVD